MGRKQWKFSFSCLIEMATSVWLFESERHGRKYSLFILNNITVLQPTLHKWSRGGRQDGLWEKQAAKRSNAFSTLTVWPFDTIYAQSFVQLAQQGYAACVFTAHLHVRAICEPFPQPIYSLPRDLAEFCNLREVWFVRCSVKWNWFVLQQDWWEDQSLGIK